VCSDGLERGGKPETRKERMGVEIKVARDPK